MTRRNFGKVAAVGLPTAASAATSVSTAQYDNTRDAINDTETVLTPTTVASPAFGLRGHWTLDGPIWGQVLYAPGVGGKNLAIVATSNNTIYALDTMSPGAPVWSTNFGASWTNAPWNSAIYGQAVGINATPVIDAVNGWVFLVTANATPTFTLRKLRLSDGVQLAHTDIVGLYPGTGAGTVGGIPDVTSGGNVVFTAIFQNQHVPLAISNGNVYVGFGSGREDRVWHGWMFAYDEATLSQQGVLLLTPNGDGGGVWESSGGPAIDGSGNLYFLTGNGDWNGTSNYSQSVIKTNSSLVITDWFTPSDWASTNAVDADVSSGRLMLIPGTHYLTWASKDGRVWVLDMVNLGHLQPANPVPQVFTSCSVTPSSSSGIYGGLFFRNVGYFPCASHVMSSYTYSGASYTTSPLAVTVSIFPQMMLTGSSNAGAAPIVWASTVSASAFSTPQVVTLRAFDAVTLVELWNSGSSIGNYAKFVAPTIADGIVLLPTNDGTVWEWGLSNNGGSKLSGKLAGKAKKY